MELAKIYEMLNGLDDGAEAVCRKRPKQKQPETASSSSLKLQRT